MVLESLMDPLRAEDKPLHVFAVTFVYTIIAMAFALQLFPTQASILSVALVTIIFVPFFQKLFERQEKEEDKAAHRSGKNLLERHRKSIYTFSSFFLAVVLATSFVFLVFPTTEPLFTLQESTIQRLSGVTGSATGAFSNDAFLRFISNNTQVMVLLFFLSILFGAGAILVLVWNATVIGVFAGLVAKSFGNSATAYLYGVPVGLGSIALHGIPEIGAYFIAGLAGGILSVGIIKEKVGSPEFHTILKDAVILMVVAEIMIIAAAYLEVVF